MEFTISIGMDSEIAVPAIIVIAGIMGAWIFARIFTTPEEIVNHIKQEV